MLFSLTDAAIIFFDLIIIVSYRVYRFKPISWPFNFSFNLRKISNRVFECSEHSSRYKNDVPLFLQIKTNRFFSIEMSINFHLQQIALKREDVQEQQSVVREEKKRKY